MVSKENQPTPADIRRAVDDANANLMRFTKGQDPQGMASLYTDDATLFPPTGEVVTSKAAIAEHWRQGIAAGLRDVDLKTVSLTPLNADHACEIGSYTVHLEDPSAGSISQSGMYVVIWKRGGDGRWRLHVDVPVAP
ncbi:MAG: SgcJ/EcaC family oxidoreductase [Candidatus Binatia bacterium]